MKQYKIIAIKLGASSSKNINKLEEEFNRLGNEGWVYKDELLNGAYYIFEKDL